MPQAHRASASGLGLSIGSLRALADLLASLDEHEGAAECRAVAEALEPMAARVKALGPRVEELYPVLAAKEIEESKRQNEARLAREKAETLRRLLEQDANDRAIK